MRQHGISNRVIVGESKNWRTGMPYTQEELDLYDIPPDVLERYIHPVLSRRLTKRLGAKVEAEKNNPEAYNKEMDEWVGYGNT